MQSCTRCKGGVTRLLPQLALAALVLCSTARTETLSESDKQEALRQLERTQEGLHKATGRLSEEQWKFKPGPDRWSVAEIFEHIVLVEDWLRENTSKQVMQAPPGNPDRDYKSVDKLVLTAIADRSRKAQAPQEVQPTGRWSYSEALAGFTKSRAQTMGFLGGTAGLRDHVADSPLGQPLDAYQWVLFISAHCERHTKQILEVKADPNFPRN